MNFLVGDDPLSKQEEDRLDHASTVGRLTEILLNEQHPKSITIGLVGPWGNGKSSVMQMIKSSIESSDPHKGGEIISIQFLPYLNHNENDIINEFFTTLSNEIAPYSGRLSSQLLDYSQKLTDLYQNKSITSFLENQVANFSKLSASTLYSDIDETLGRIDKKIIIFVDDLDRLSPTEILQTLKLIRNTANFRNTFFIVAMDKEYVVKRLREKGNILDTRFVDKFFQLEVYLPEIDNTVLKNYFIEELLKANPLSPSPDNFTQLLDEALSSPLILFEHYVKNFRDAKRAVNQIRYDLSLYKEDFAYLNLKDFINFTFMKLKFPSVLKQLNDNMGDYLEIDKSQEGVYRLIKNEPAAENLTPEQINAQISDTLFTEEIANIKELKKYIIYQKILGGRKKNNKLGLKINRSDKKLLIKTLAFLFGEENHIESQDSIRYINNFQMLAQQRIFSNYFKQAEFEKLHAIGYELLKPELGQIEKDGKTPQLLDRLKYFASKDPEKLKRTIEYSVLLYENSALKGRYDNEIFRLINKFTEELHKLSEDKQQYKDWINEAIFTNKSLKPEMLLNLVEAIWRNRHIEELWHFDQPQFASIAAKIYKNYMASYTIPATYDNNINNIYHAYNQVKDIAREEANETFKDFWQGKNIEFLCMLMTDLESALYTVFKISSFATEIFGSKSDFIRFVASHQDHGLESVKEFLAFYRLLEITGHSSALLYDFSKSKMMKKKVDANVSSSASGDFPHQSHAPQLIVKITDIELGGRFPSAVSYSNKFKAASFIFQEEFYLKIDILEENIDYWVSRIIDKLIALDSGHAAFDYQNTEIQENTKIYMSADNYIEFVSIKPKQEKIKYIEESGGLAP